MKKVSWIFLGIGAFITICAELAQIFSYLETSQRVPEVTTMLSNYLPSPAFIHLFTMLAILTSILICLWQINVLDRRLTEHLSQQGTPPPALDGELSYLFSDRSLAFFRSGHLTMKQTAELIQKLRDARESWKDQQPVTSIKIVSTQDLFNFAQALVNIFRVAGYTFIIDQTSHQEIFPVTKEHKEIIVRYRKSDDPLQDGCYSEIQSTLDVYINNRLVEFPKETSIDYLQIEIGGAP